jgi:hypothetical protein
LQKYKPISFLCGNLTTAFMLALLRSYYQPQPGNSNLNEEGRLTVDSKENVNYQFAIISF